MMFSFANSWGSGRIGQLGTDNTDDRGDGPGEMSSLPFITFRNATLPVSQVSAGGAHSCALFSDGSVVCWGYGAYGQLGQGSTNDIGNVTGSVTSTIAIAFSDSTVATMISSGWHHAYFFIFFLSVFFISILK